MIQQSRPDFENGEWVDCVLGSTFDFSTYMFRIKPEPPKPREFWLEPICNGGGVDRMISDKPLTGWIHVREVLL